LADDRLVTICGSDINREQPAVPVLGVGLPAVQGLEHRVAILVRDDGLEEHAKRPVTASPGDGYDPRNLAGRLADRAHDVHEVEIGGMERGVLYLVEVAIGLRRNLGPFGLFRNWWRKQRD
jgi:hypothetical protein